MDQTWDCFSCLWSKAKVTAIWACNAQFYDSLVTSIHLAMSVHLTFLSALNKLHPNLVLIDRCFWIGAMYTVLVMFIVARQEMANSV